jgi:diguanylate cyclase (GGDEF)-like protein
MAYTATVNLGVLGSLRARAVVVVALGVAIAAGVVLLAADVLGRREADSGLDRGTRVAASVVAGSLAPRLASGDHDAIARTARRAAERPGVVLVVVFDRSRRPVVSEPAGTPPGPVLGAWPEGEVDRVSLRLGRVPVEACFQVVGNGDDELGGVWLAADRTPVEEAFAGLRLTGLLFLLGLVALFALLAWWVTGGVVRSLLEFGQSAEAIGRGELATRHPEAGPEEVRGLARRVNRMAERLEANRAEQARLAAGLDAQVRDRTRQLEQANRLLINIAHKDPLTNIENRRGFERELEKYLSLCRRSGQPLAIIMIDLDGFKAFNDTWGHAAGDQVLAAVGAALRGRARASDTVGRLGGDEFCILIPSTRPERALAAAEGFVAAIVEATRDLPRPGADANVGASAGVACFPEDGDEAAELLARADAALYRAKAAGKGRVFRAAPPLPDQQA